MNQPRSNLGTENRATKYPAGQNRAARQSSRGVCEDTLRQVLGVRPIGVTWGLLVAATVVTTWILTMHSIDHRWAAFAMLAVAAWKVWLVLSDFMELRDAPPAGRLLFGGWAVALPVVLAVLVWH